MITLQAFAYDVETAAGRAALSTVAESINKPIRSQRLIPVVEARM
jgi:hypothetical protein